MKIELPFPSSSLSGNGAKFGAGQWAKIKATKAHREWARLATLAAMNGDHPYAVDDQQDIAITIRFIPPNNRGDRVGFPYRMKPYFDGIAEALKVNDRRFDPMFIYCEPEKPGRVEIYLQRQPCPMPSDRGTKKTAGARPRKPRTGHVENAIRERLT